MCDVPFPHHKVNHRSTTRSIHEVLHRAIISRDVPNEVKRLVLETNISGIDAVDAASDARLLLRAINSKEEDFDSAVMRNHAYRVAAREWQRELPPELANMAAQRLVQILEEWADCELEAVL